MPPRESARVQLQCCGKEHLVTFDHDEAPFLPPHVFRKNVLCPVCDGIVIMTLFLSAEGEHTMEQELL